MNNQRCHIEQGRSAYAYEAVEEAKQQLDKNSVKEYRAYIQKLPMLIKTNGLGAAIAFVFSKGSKNGFASKKKAWGLIYSQLEYWILERDRKQLIDFRKGELAKALSQSDCQSYRAVTIEIMALLAWMKRYANALIED